MPLPPRVFLVPMPNAARHSAHTWRLFLNINCVYFSKKSIGSGRVTRADLLTLHLGKVCNHVRARVFFGAISSLQVFITVPTSRYVLSVYLRNFNICDLRSGQTQSRNLYITSLWENIEMRPASSKQVKTITSFPDYGILSDL